MININKDTGHEAAASLSESVYCLNSPPPQRSYLINTPHRSHINDIYLIFVTPTNASTANSEESYLNHTTDAILSDCFNIYQAVFEWIHTKALDAHFPVSPTGQTLRPQICGSSIYAYLNEISVSFFTWH